MNNKLTFTAAEAKLIGTSLGIDWEHFDIEEFRLGLEVEGDEHGCRDKQTDITHNNPLLISKIVLAHLQKLPDYYSRLARMEARAAEFSPEIDRFINMSVETSAYGPQETDMWAALQEQMAHRIENLTGRIHNLAQLHARAENGTATQFEAQLKALQEDRTVVYEKKLDMLQAQKVAITDGIKELELQKTVAVMKVKAKFDGLVNQLKAEREAVQGQWQTEVEAQLTAWQSEIHQLQTGWERAQRTQAQDAFAIDQVEALENLQSKWHDLRLALENSLHADISGWAVEVSDLKAQQTGCDTWEEFEREQQISRLVEKMSQAEVKLHHLIDMAIEIQDVNTPDQQSQPEWLGYLPITFH